MEIRWGRGIRIKNAFLKLKKERWKNEGGQPPYLKNKLKKVYILS